MKLRNSNIMKKKLLSKKTCQIKQRISLNKQMQSLNNRKREVEVMVVDIVVEEEVGAGLTILKEAVNLEDIQTFSKASKTKRDKISTSKTEEEVEAGVEVVDVEAIHSSETKIKNKLKIVIFLELKLWKKKGWKIITEGVDISEVKEAEVLEVTEVNSEEIEVREANSEGIEVTEENSEVVVEVEEHSISMKVTSSKR